VTAFASALANLDPDSPRANIASIKSAVIAQLRANDPRVLVHTTDHFNHTFVPDLVLRWANEKDERKVFLRASFESSELLQDLSELGQDHPIIMSLVHVPNQNGEVVDEARPEVSEALAEASRRSRVLVTDPYGLSALQTETEIAPVVGILSRAVLQGGRGLVGEVTARQAGQRVGAGFGAAQQHNVEITEQAVQESEQILDLQHASRVTRLLQAVWVGSGASGASFPGQIEVGSPLDEAGLRFLLGLPDIRDDAFWKRVGADLTLQRLCDLTNLETSDNLHALLRGTGHRLQTKACRVRQLDTTIRSPEWSVIGGVLQLRVADQAASFAPKKTAELPSADTEPPAVNMANVRDRATQSGAVVEALEMATDSRQMAYGSIEHTDVSHDDNLGQFENVLGPLASVRAATLRLSLTRTLRCDFNSRTAAGKSNARFFLPELVTVAVPMLATFNDSTYEHLAGLIEPRPTLVDEANAPEAAEEEALPKLESD
jgi:hypothetical protein